MVRGVTILILIDGFLQFKQGIPDFWFMSIVTILILIDGFLQCEIQFNKLPTDEMSQSLF